MLLIKPNGIIFYLEKSESFAKANYPGYRLQEVEEVEILKFPRVEVPNGLPVRVSKH